MAEARLMTAVARTFSRYRSQFSTPGTAIGWLAALPGRLPLAVNPLALLLLGKASTGNVGEAGLLAGVFVAANATGAIIQGRLIDAYGPRRIIVWFGLVHCAALLGICAAIGRVPFGGVLPIAVVGGFTLPQLSACVRSMWAHFLKNDEVKRTAFALETVVIEMVSVAGPLFAATTFVINHRLPLIVSAVLAAGGSVGFAMSPASGRIPRRGYVRHGIGFLASAPAGICVAVTFLVGAMAGGIDVGVVAYAAAHSAIASAGLYLACFAVGSVLGGLFFSAWSSGASKSPDVQIAALVIADTVLLAGLACYLPPAVTAVLIFALGTSAAPLYTLLSISLNHLAVDSPAEAYTVFVTTALGGSAAGTAIGGLTAGSTRGTGAFALGAACTLIAASVAVVARRHEWLAADRPEDQVSVGK